MKIGVVKETFPEEKRVALIPRIIPSLTQGGSQVLIETGAGEAAGYSDTEYQARGATLVEDRFSIIRQADILLYVRAYGANREAGGEDLTHYKPAQVVIGFMEPLDDPEAAEELARTGVTAFALELLPRITRAQSMDALSSMATIAGYKSVILAANALPRMFPMLMTPAGTITPARVLVIGAAVAGLQAIATARRLGGVVQAYDIRPVVKEQVESLGAKFVELALDTKETEAKGGYAREMGEEFYRKQRELLTRIVGESNVVITTATVPGKKAPVLLTADMVRAMSPGSVVVDLAIERGGNCELSRPNKTVVENGVIIIAPLNIASTVPYHASQLYAKNVANLVLHLVKEGQLALDRDDEIIRETMLTKSGKVTNPAVNAARRQRTEENVERSNR